ncbi:MAG: hypothetical protein IJA15_08205, partial [Clostridia bacterium]|nr:hypothetical protein [Clostridia bacterium]
MKGKKITLFLICSLIICFCTGLIACGGLHNLDSSSESSFIDPDDPNIDPLIPNAYILTNRAIYETEPLPVRANVPGIFYHGKAMLGEITEDSLNTLVNINAPIDLSGRSDIIDCALTFVPNEEYCLKNDMKFSPGDKVNCNVKIKAVAYIANNKEVKYSSIQKAISDCNRFSATTDVVVITGTNMKVTRDIIVPAGVNLVFPFYDSLYTSQFEGLYTPSTTPYIACSYGAGYMYTVGREEKETKTVAVEQLHAKTDKGGNLYDYTDGTAEKVAKYRKILITMTNGADITVAQKGILSLGGEYGVNSMKGRYTQINLDEESSINVEGSFYCEGFVKEINGKKGDQEENSTNYNNDFDSGRLIHITSTGFLQTGLAIYDMKSGGTLTSLLENGVFAINKFDFPYMQTYVQIDHGGKFYAFSHANVVLGGIEQQVNKLAPILEPANSGITAVFYSKKGNASFEYCPKNSEYTSATAKTRVFLNGELSLGSMTLKIATHTITTVDKFTPISNKFAIFINDGATFTMSDKIKLLPGALLQINKGGKINVNSALAVYKASHCKFIEGYGSNHTDAQFINNGRVTVGSSGSIGGFLQTTAVDGSAILDFSAVKNASSFSVSSNEWSEIPHVVNVVSEGYFENDGEQGVGLYQFIEGSVVTSASSGVQAWSGNKVSTQTLNLSLAEVSFEKKVYGYQIFVANNKNGTNSIEITSGETQDIASYAIPKHNYVQFVPSRCASVTINGEQLNSNTWYYVDADIEVVITPNKGIPIYLYTDALSGNASTIYTVTESSEENGTFYQIFKDSIGGKASKETILVVENYYFKIKYQSNGATQGTTVVDKGIVELGPTDVGAEVGNPTKAYKATDSYTFYYSRKDSCVVEGTLVTLADGTQKPVEQLTYADEILVFNHETGKIEKGNIATLDHLDLERAWYDVINLKFSNGNILRTVWNHGLYNVTLNRYVFIHEGNYKDYIGDEFYSVKYV